MYSFLYISLKYTSIFKLKVQKAVHLLYNGQHRTNHRMLKSYSCIQSLNNNETYCAIYYKVCTDNNETYCAIYYKVCTDNMGKVKSQYKSTFCCKLELFVKIVSVEVWNVAKYWRMQIVYIHLVKVLSLIKTLTCVRENTS